MQVTYTRLYTDSQGQSQFEDMSTDLKPGLAVPPAEPLHVAEFLGTEGSYWVGVPSDWNGDVVHPTPRRQIFVTVRGEYEVTTGDRAARRFPVGSVLLVEDTTGVGHASKITSEQEVLIFAVGLPPNASG